MLHYNCVHETTGAVESSTPLCLQLQATIGSSYHHELATIVQLQLSEVRVGRTNGTTSLVRYTLRRHDGATALILASRVPSYRW